MKVIHKELLPGIYTMGGNGVRHTLQYSGDTPVIDILVRESIQNSFDALLDSAEYLDMRYNVGSFHTSDIGDWLDDFHEAAGNRFPEESYYLEIRDVDTYGLDGPLETTVISEYGRLMKLVYSIGEKQQGEGKGGSWGYGKTNYYNIGIGLVIYYSRTIFNGEPQDRLVASIIEDTDHKDSMLFPNSQLGMSFWGREGIEDPGRAIPLTDSEEITSFLKIFGLKEFDEGKTGTSIIIPFIDRKELLRDTVTRIFDKEDIVIDVSEFQFYVELAVQRWYFPRLLNKGDNKLLRFSFNDELLVEDSVEPLFKLMREIYNDTFSEDSSNPVSISSSLALPANTVVARYSSRNGRIADLGENRTMTMYQMLEIKNDSYKSNPPIGFRCRSLGMINCYEIEDGIVKGTTLYSPEEYLIIGMRLIPDVTVIDPDSKTVISTLENYVRKGENPAHTRWSDVNLHDINASTRSATPLIISTMISNISKSFSDGNERDMIVSKRNIGLGKKVGKLFLPAKGYGTGSGPRPPRVGGTGGDGVKKVDSISSTSVRYNKDEMEITLSVKFFGKDKHSLIKMTPDVKDESFDSIDDWEEKCGIRFPISIKSIKVVSIDGECYNEVVTNNLSERTVGGCVFAAHGVDDEIYALEITNPGGVREVCLIITLNKRSSNFNIKFSLEAVHNYE